MLGLLHLWLWLKNRSHIRFLLSCIMAMSAGANALLELALMHAQSTHSYALILQTQVTFVYLLLMTLVWLIRVQLGDHQRWLAYTIAVLWSLALVFNFLSPGSLIYEQVTEIHRSMTFWGEQYNVGYGPPNIWNLLSNIAVVLIILYVIINSRNAWQQGEKRRAISLGGSIVLFLVLGGTNAVLVDNGILRTPYMISFSYLAIVLAMSYELVSQAIQVPLLTRTVVENQKRWQDLLDNIQLAVIVVNTEGVITYANPFLQRLTGYAEKDLIQQYVGKLLPVTERQTLPERLKSAMVAGPRPHSQWRIICASGKERYLAWSTVRQFGSDGQVTGFVGVGTDITEQIQTQHDLRQIQQEVERITRANMLGELASTLAHELNQPLAAILSNAQAARRMLSADKLEQQMLFEILDDIVRDDKRASEVIHGLRSMLQHNEPIRGEHAVADIVREVMQIVDIEAQAQGIVLKLTMSADLPPICVNKVEIQQVVMNLIINALRVQKTVSQDGRNVHIQVVVQDDMIQFQVRDHGPGIKEEDVEKIFKPFFTTHREGLGMGLALSKRIVEAHGGKIRAENHPEGGALFTFTIPVVAK